MQQPRLAGLPCGAHQWPHALSMPQLRPELRLQNNSVEPLKGLHADVSPSLNPSEGQWVCVGCPGIRALGL